MCLERVERQYKFDSLWHAQASKTQGDALQSPRQARAYIQEEEIYSTAWGIPPAPIERHYNDARYPHCTKRIESCYVRCTSSLPIFCTAPLSWHGNRRGFGNVNIGRRLGNVTLMWRQLRYVNIIRMKSGLRCVIIWTRLILEKDWDVCICRIFKSSDAYRAR